MKKTMILIGTLALLTCAGGTAAQTGIPDLSNSYAVRAYDGPETLSLYILPNGQGYAFNEAYLPGTPNGGPGTFADATITLTMLDSGYFPIPVFPFEDIWLQSADGGMVVCPGGTVANENTDANGETHWRYPLFAGGSSTSPLRVYINGDALITGDIALNVNSPDIDGNLAVNLSDVTHFAGSYYGAYSYSCDFNFDGALNLSDLGLMANGVGAECP